MAKMNVVAYKSTHHVLGAVTRTMQADQAMTVGDVAASGMLVRSASAPALQALLGAALLEIALVDYDTRLVYRPHLFVVTDGQRVEQQEDTAAPTVTLNANAVTVTLPVVTPSDIEVFVHLTGGALAEPVVVAVAIAHTAKEGSMNLVLGAGEYTAVIFAPGYATTMLAVTGT
jgi:hypothetical protein